MDFEFERGIIILFLFFCLCFRRRRFVLNEDRKSKFYLKFRSKSRLRSRSEEKIIRER